MARDFVILTQADVDVLVARNIRAREFELAAYDFERDGHEKSIALIGALVWESADLPYRGLSRDAMIARALKDGLDETAILRLGDLIALDGHMLNLQAVKIETTRSERHYDALLTALPKGAARDAAVALIETADPSPATVVKSAPSPVVLASP